MALAAIDMLCMMPEYGVYNEQGMVEARKAVCAYLDITLTEEQANDARGWCDFIRTKTAYRDLVQEYR